MKNSGIKLPVILAFLGAVSCQSPFFGDLLKSEHIEEEVYIPPQYDRIMPPLSVSATTDRIDKIELSWSAVAGAAGYNVYRSESLETGFELLAEVQEPSYTDTGAAVPLKSGFTFYYKVSTLNTENVESALTEPVAGRCYLQNGEVVPPAVVLATQGGSDCRNRRNCL